ncbi:hypothetical protein TRFO_06476 [Tritrichomonas foetus]|uniref:Uncharacterized protein n=1 Tax=Tritrichomonas foetus TaxID=1144522 RepID=A0A1J4K350_9EUKA|nr:hypothetical protein TRFO_06476 [Tritrichomonas foetus]|eukprot:OHT04150.1 hypothetical protein TRFO_06476 [Tritrichomonas foetus]
MRSKQPFKQKEITKKPLFNKNAKSKTHQNNYSVSTTPRFKDKGTKTELKLTPISINSPKMVRSSSIPDMLDAHEVSWERRERSVSPVLPMTPRLPKPNKPDVNQFGLTKKQIQYIEILSLSLLIMICLMSAVSIKEQYTDSNVPQFLFLASAITLFRIFYQIFKLFYN